MIGQRLRSETSHPSLTIPGVATPEVVGWQRTAAPGHPADRTYWQCLRCLLLADRLSWVACSCRLTPFARSPCPDCSRWSICWASTADLSRSAWMDVQISPSLLSCHNAPRADLTPVTTHQQQTSLLSQRTKSRPLSCDNAPTADLTTHQGQTSLLSQRTNSRPLSCHNAPRADLTTVTTHQEQTSLLSQHTKRIPRSCHNAPRADLSPVTTHQQQTSLLSQRTKSRPHSCTKHCVTVCGIASPGRVLTCRSKKPYQESIQCLNMRAFQCDT